jgi:hypothetical protein
VKKKKRRAPSEEPRAVTAKELRQLRRELERRLRPDGRSPGGAGPPQKTLLAHHPRKTKGGRKTQLARKRSGGRWNPDPDDVQRSVAQLVLTLVEFLRQLMERQAIRRMEEKTLTPGQVESVGAALMKLEETIRDIGKRFGLKPEDLNLDLGPLKLM